MQNGVIDDPYYRYNDVEYRWIALLDWYYSRSFEVSEELYSNEKVLKPNLFFHFLILILISLLSTKYFFLDLISLLWD